MKKVLLTIAVFYLLTICVSAQTQYDTIYNYKTNSEVTIDGQALEDCWENAEWHEIDQVWIPYGATMSNGDFSGKFKVSWDESFLYVLVEVVDDMLSDDHSNPLQSWWEDDCLEVFIDEDRSMGNHERNNNAFAYHISLFYDAVDLNSSGQGVNYKNHIEADMDTLAENTYLWEIAIKIYDETYSSANPENSRVDLFHHKLMGMAVAYCDNDQSNGRENFIGSMYMTQSHYNDMYKNADYFGPMLLIDDTQTGLNSLEQDLDKEIDIFPIPAKNQITISSRSINTTNSILTISSLTGQVLKKNVLFANKQTIDIGELDAGIYVLKINDGNNCFSKIISKY
jgi:hypothetical protein